MFWINYTENPMKYSIIFYIQKHAFELSHFMPVYMQIYQGKWIWGVTNLLTVHLPALDNATVIILNLVD